jgi:hypothetical protein
LIKKNREKMPWVDLIRTIESPNETEVVFVKHLRRNNEFTRLEHDFLGDPRYPIWKAFAKNIGKEDTFGTCWVEDVTIHHFK